MIPGDHNTVDILSVAECVGYRLPGNSESEAGLLGILWSTACLRQGGPDANMSGVVEDGFDVIPAMPLPYGLQWVVFRIFLLLQGFDSSPCVFQSLSCQNVDHRDGLIDFRLSAGMIQSLR